MLSIPFTVKSGVLFHPIESLSKRRFCQHGRQPEVNRVVIDGEWWRQPFSFEITNVKAEWLPLLISNENGWHHHSPSITARFTSGWRPCWQKRRLLKLSNMTILPSLLQGSNSCANCSEQVHRNLQVATVYINFGFVDFDIFLADFRW